MTIGPVRSRSSEVDHMYNLRSRENDSRPELDEGMVELQPHVLHITLFLKVGSSLTDFRKSRDLCIALRDALQSTQMTYLHCDYC